MKSYIVIGLGRFGQGAACQLCELGAEVLAMDVRSDLVQQVASNVTHAVVGDAQDKDVLRALGVRDMECAIIAIGEDLVNRNINDDLVGKHEESRKFPQVFADLCAAMGVDMLDAQTIAEPSMIDCIHMSPEGHQALGKAVAEKIAEMMAR